MCVVQQAPDVAAAASCHPWCCTLLFSAQDTQLLSWLLGINIIIPVSFTQESANQTLRACRPLALPCPALPSALCPLPCPLSPSTGWPCSPQGYQEEEETLYPLFPKLF